MAGFRSLSCPGDAYFVYESCQMSNWTKLTMFIFSSSILESEILSCQNRKRCSCVLYLQEVSDTHSQQQAAALQYYSRSCMTNASPTTVFRALINVSTFFDDQAIQRQSIWGNL